MKTEPLTLERFLTVRHGDILTRDRGADPRLVLVGPGDGDPDATERPESASRQHVWFPIRRRSWTGRAKTLVNFADLKRRGYTRVWRPKTARDICGIERDLLAQMGFDWVAQLRREIREWREYCKRCGGRRWFPTDAVKWLERFADRAERKGKHVRR